MIALNAQVPPRVPRSKRSSATRSSSRSRSASSAASRRGTIRCIRWSRKIAPALAAGCTVVLKPAELAPLSALMLADAAHEIGLPGGVLNVVCGAGRVVGEAIVGHPDVDMVSFTGSLQAGRRVASLAGDGIKKVWLELGGKSAFVVLDDAPFEKAIAGGREQLHAELRADLLGVDAHARAASAPGRSRRRSPRRSSRKLTLGDPFDAKTRLGPLASAQSARHRARLHRAGQEGRRQARRRRRPARGRCRRASTSSRRSSPTSTTG